MPTYGYRCTSCGTEFERVQKMTDAPLTTCEACGGALKKLLYPIGIQFKGSGFYVNDYAKPSSTATASGGSNGSAASSTESSSTTETPAAPASSSTETKEAKPATPAPATPSTSKPGTTP